jgi:hypothetical protein
MINQHAQYEHKKIPFLLWTESYYGAKYIFTVEDAWGNLLCAGKSNIIEFKSGDTEKFTNCWQGIGHVWILKCFCNWRKFSNS